MPARRVCRAFGYPRPNLRPGRDRRASGHSFPVKRAFRPNRFPAYRKVTRRSVRSMTLGPDDCCCRLLSQAVEMGADDGVTLARRGFETPAIDHGDMPGV